MIRYALDNDVLSVLKTERDAIAALGRLPLVITGSVWDEFCDLGGDPDLLRRDREMLEAIAGERVDIEPQTPEAEAFAMLMASTPAIHEGEASIIALAFRDSGITPVLIDRRAIWRAVEELRGRVIAVHAFLDVLRSDHGLAPAVAGRLASAYRRRQSMSAPPMWWT